MKIPGNGSLLLESSLLSSRKTARDQFQTETNLEISDSIFLRGEEIRKC